MAESDIPDIVEQTLYVPYSEDPPGHIWSIDRHLQIIMSAPEDMAIANAEEFFDSHIFFYAELTMDEGDVDTMFVDDQPILHRDAGTGQFVTEEFAEENPETTVTENE